MKTEVAESPKPPMTKVQRLHYLLAREPEINRWRERALRKLLPDAAPRLAVLSNTLYAGCGFHYGMLNQLGKLISVLLSEDRTEDAARAAVDETFREQMYQKYGIGKPKK